jgi:mRNA-degrading endonuclease RelE of RelBE toxin-antitoxin system
VTYRATWTGPAERDVARLPPRAAVAVIVYVDERLCADPHRRSKELGGDLAGMRGARNGDYRVILTIDDEDEVVWIHRVNHRAHIYRR